MSDGLRLPPSRSKFAGTCLGTYVCCSFLGPKYGASEGRRAEYLRGCSFRCCSFCGSFFCCVAEIPARICSCCAITFRRSGWASFAIAFRTSASALRAASFCVVSMIRDSERGIATSGLANSRVFTSAGRAWTAYLAFRASSNFLLSISPCSGSSSGSGGLVSLTMMAQASLKSAMSECLWAGRSISDSVGL